MSIHNVKAETPIEPGKWICKDSIFTDGICGHPRIVVSASKSRVYYTNTRGENEGDYCSKKSVRFICDTEQEAKAMHQISQEQEKELSDSRKAIMAKHKARIAELLAKEPA